MASNAEKKTYQYQLQVVGANRAAKDLEQTRKGFEDVRKEAEKAPDGPTSLVGRLDAGMSAVKARSEAVSGALGRVRERSAGLVSGLSKPLAMAESFVTAGLRSNADRQSERTAFAGLLGSRRKAQPFANSLHRQVGMQSPRTSGEIAGSAKQLLGSGMNATNTVKTLKAVNTAMLATGGGAQQFTRVVDALAQIQAKGKASTVELNQLAQAGVPVNEILRKQLGLTAEEAANVGEQGLSSADALGAITSGWQQRFGKSAKTARKDFNNQVAQMRNDWEDFRQVATKPLFTLLSERVLPRLSKALRHVTKTFSRNDLTFSQKVKLSWKGVKEQLAPLAKDLKTAIDDMQLGRRFRDAVTDYGPKIVNALVDALVLYGPKIVSALVTVGIKAAPKVAKAFWEGFKNLGTGGKVLTAAALLLMFRSPFGKAGALLGRLFGRAVGLPMGTSFLSWGVRGVRTLGTSLRGQVGRLASAGRALGRSMGSALGSRAASAGRSALHRAGALTRGLAGTMGRFGRSLGSWLGSALGSRATSAGRSALRAAGALTRGLAATMGRFGRSLGSWVGSALGSRAANTARGALRKAGALTRGLGETMAKFGRSLGRMLGGAMASTILAAVKGALGKLGGLLGKIPGLGFLKGGLGKLSPKVVAKGLGRFNPWIGAGLLANDVNGVAHKRGFGVQDIWKTFSNGMHGAGMPRATGGRVRPGEITLVGEQGPELALFPAGTEIVPNHRWDGPSRQRRRRNGDGSRERVVYLSPTVLQLDGSVLWQSVSRQQELRELPH